MLGENRSEQALIILDMINDIAHPEGGNFEPATLEIVPLVQGELKYFRERMRLVIFVHTDMGEGHDFKTQIIQSLSPRSKEIILSKKGPNAFFDTDLAKILHEHRIGSVAIVGAFSHTSVARTVASALDHGFSVVVPETCTCSRKPQDHQAALHLINGWLSG